MSLTRKIKLIIVEINSQLERDEEDQTEEKLNNLFLSLREKIKEIFDDV